MDIKKIIISILAIASIAVALVGVWRWREQAANQPVRQGQEIR